MKKNHFYFLSILVLILMVGSNLFSQKTTIIYEDLDIDGEYLSFERQEVKEWVKKAIKAEPPPAKKKVEKKVKKKFPKGEVRKIAEEFGLLEETKTNPHLSFLTGDISYWYEQELSETRLRLEFAARRAVLEAADKQGVIIKDQGTLSWAAPANYGQHAQRKKISP